MKDDLEKQKRMRNIPPLIPKRSQAEQTLTVFVFSSHCAQNSLRWSRLCHWLGPDRVGDA